MSVDASVGVVVAVGVVATGRAPRHERESTTRSTAQSSCAWPCALNSTRRSRGVHPCANAVCSPDDEIRLVALDRMGPTIKMDQWQTRTKARRHLLVQALTRTSRQGTRGGRRWRHCPTSFSCTPSGTRRVGGRPLVFPLTILAPPPYGWGWGRGEQVGGVEGRGHEGCARVSPLARGGPRRRPLALLLPLALPYLPPPAAFAFVLLHSFIFFNSKTKQTKKNQNQPWLQTQKQRTTRKRGLR
jgi:hypothetical protein